MPRLIAFGCSCTYGSYLEDDPKNKYFPHGGQWDPSKHAWPAKLGELMFRDVVNTGHPGASNKRIWYSIMDYNFQEDDLVFILWTFKHRWCVFHKDKDHMDINWDQNSHELNHKKYGKLPNYYKYFQTDFDDDIDFSLRIDHTTKFLKQKNIKHYHMLLESDKKRISPWVSIQDIPVVLENVNKKVFGRQDFASDGLHPGRLGHKVLAKKLWRICHDERKV